jgi:hypothetical protein
VDAVRARLGETPDGTLSENGKSLVFEAAPKDVVTVLSGSSVAMLPLYGREWL